jgi:hypothetical protein
MSETTSKPNTPNPWLVFVGGPIIAFLASYAGVQATIAEMRVEVRALQQGVISSDSRLSQRMRDMDEARIRSEARSQATDLVLAQVQERLNALRDTMIAVDRRAQENDVQLMGVIRQIQERLAQMRQMQFRPEIERDL